MAGDPVIALGRAFLIETTSGTGALLPAMLPFDKLPEFVRGFADTPLFRAGQENQMRVGGLARRRSES
ncbi:hypothetical protein FHX42_005019 [Saccharopolyspora lacisalsi]|uniref:Uncharacterized protein n=2 Tax=Halosaccharopolyspora lacisalsi TaxID=1000566 RepID=A0A839E2W1_9PSEU|nr:hypothetical protein [Halosaccharopolyspora lacisalsi]